jgi:hypothetical protein
MKHKWDMKESLFVLTKSRVTIAIIYTAIVGFLLAEKFWADYCYHVTKALMWPDAYLAKNLLWPLLLTLLLLWFSFVYGRGKPPILSFSAILNEMFFTAMILYTAWSVGLLKKQPFVEFLQAMAIFVAIVGVFRLIFRMTARATPHFAEWMIGCIILALACFGYYRAVSNCLGLPQHTPVAWRLEDFINYWKDIFIYVAIGAFFLQGVLRITLAIDEKGSETPRTQRVILFAVYIIACLLVIGVLGGAGDLIYLGSGEFYAMTPPLQELVRFHIYFRGTFLIVSAFGNGAWLYFKLFVKNI